MTESEAIEALKKCQENKDIEKAHSDADEILCQLLIYLGCQEVVNQYEQVEKWYA